MAEPEEEQRKILKNYSVDLEILVRYVQILSASMLEHVRF